LDNDDDDDDDDDDINNNYAVRDLGLVACSDLNTTNRKSLQWAGGMITVTGYTLSLPFIFILYFTPILRGILTQWNTMWSWGSSVSTVSDYGLDGRGSIPDRSRGFSL
jgi:hypothetical protein